jgi:hypothetical protein
MVTVPARLWRFGPLVRGLLLGVGVGGVLGVLAWLDSGFWFAGVFVFVILGLFYGIWMTRRMSRYWPAAAQLNGPDRELVARAARDGQRVGDSRLAQSVVDYRDALHLTAADARPLRWLLWVVLVVAAGTAVWDAAFGSWGNAVVSVIYLAMLCLELFWWPKRQRQLLANADTAAVMARGPSS